MYIQTCAQCGLCVLKSAVRGSSTLHFLNHVFGVVRCDLCYKSWHVLAMKRLKSNKLGLAPIVMKSHGVAEMLRLRLLSLSAYTYVYNSVYKIFIYIHTHAYISPYAHTYIHTHTCSCSSFISLCCCRFPELCLCGRSGASGLHPGLRVTLQTPRSANLDQHHYDCDSRQAFSTSPVSHGQFPGPTCIFAEAPCHGLDRLYLDAELAQ